MKHYLQKLTNPSLFLKRSGQSLMEVLIGVVIGGLLIVGAAAIIIPSIAVTKQTATIQVASSFANGMITDAQSWATGNWSNVLALATGTSNTYYFNESSSPFTVVRGGAPSIWQNGYSYRRAITFNAAQIVSSTQTNFPVLISGTFSYLAASSTGGNVQNTNGNDIIFTSDAAGLNQLNFEQAYYNSASGTVMYWVKVPTLSSSTQIYMFYGNANVTSSQGVSGGVWDSNYMGVWHLAVAAGSGGSKAVDSTYFGNSASWSGTQSASGTSYYAAGGKTGAYAGYFNGSNNYIDTQLPISRFATGFTWQAWINTSNYSGTWSWPMAADATAGSYPWFQCGKISSNGSVRFETGDYTSLADLDGSTNIADGNWHLLTCEWDAVNNIKSISLDGTVVASASASTNNTSPNYGHFQMGAHAGPAEYWSGLINEVEVSNSARAASWVKTEYNNQNSPSTFSTIGAAITAQSGETVTIGTSTYARYFSLSDVYRDGTGKITSTPGYYDPSTKLITVTSNIVGGTTSTQTSVSEYITNNQGVSWYQRSFAYGLENPGAPQTWAWWGYQSSTNLVQAGSGNTTLQLTVASGTYASSGSVSSNVFDLGAPGTKTLQSAILLGTQPTGISFTLQVAVSNASSGPWTFIGPDGTSGTSWSLNMGTPISLVGNSGSSMYTFLGNFEYFRYKLNVSGDTVHTPTITGINFVYTP